jgi:NAD(P)-dependent dehydrogenase (short-subunit alcohol dehydrogenase family)
MASRVEGRIALVTGASSGLGRRFATVLAREGAKVVVAARRKERLDALVKELGAERALAVECDVTSEKDVIAAHDAAEKRFGLVDTVVNNAGMTHVDNALKQDVEEFRRVIDLNLTSVWMVAREAARRLIAAGPEQAKRGRIINISSMGPRIVLPGVAAYSASKAGVAHLTRALAREWAKYGINVNALLPGYISTELNSEWLESESGQKIIGKTSRRRVMPEQSLDEALLFLASDNSQFVTGTDLLADDGQSI